VKTFANWRNVGLAMLEARRREGVTVEPGGAWRRGDARVLVTDSRRGLIIDLPEGRYLDTGHLDAGQALRVLAALELIPADIAYAADERYGRCEVPGCGRLARWWPGEAEAEPRWVHTEPWLVTDHHTAEVTP
jgi:hypothetical protein